MVTKRKEKNVADKFDNRGSCVLIWPSDLFSPPNKFVWNRDPSILVHLFKVNQFLIQDSLLMRQLYQSNQMFVRSEWYLWGRNVPFFLPIAPLITLNRIDSVLMLFLVQKGCFLSCWYSLLWVMMTLYSPESESSKKTISDYTWQIGFWLPASESACMHSSLMTIGLEF